MQVYDGLFIGNHKAALSVSYLSSLGITHLLNCAHPGPEEAMSVEVNEEELRRANIEYLGLQLADESYQAISPVFERSGDWINAALSRPDSKVLVNCWAGISRSATVSLAFLVSKRRGRATSNIFVQIKHRKLTLVQAIREVKSMRDINPNRGFLKQLVDFENKVSM